MQKTFYSNGKLLLSGEYAILDGAVGLAVPTKYGQSLHIENNTSGLLEWNSFDEKGNAWFKASYNLKGLEEISSTDKTISSTLIRLLTEAKSLNPDFLSTTSGAHVQTKLDFPRNWGLGTSSTLINSMAQWAQVDAYQLLWNAFGGSGYDIACAKHDHPILFQLRDRSPNVEKVSFDLPFKESIYFVHLNQKQSSKEAIAAYRKQDFDKKRLISDISILTKKMAAASTLTGFEALMIEHEETLSKVLSIPPIKTELFPDYSGAVKSLGAWGGDFIMVTGTEENIQYFKSKGYKTIIPYTQMGHPSIK